MQKFGDRHARKQDRFEDRQARRAGAEAEWRAARQRATAKARAHGARRHAALQQSAAHWRAEARDHTDARRDDRWRKAAKRQGLLPETGVSAEVADSSGRLITQREADDAAERSINRENADAELQRLRREIENDR
ncbi:MAG: hypothetical protein ACYTEY_15270 [Planctomycetota bacterium]|jgi:hypothetical protein